MRVLSLNAWGGAVGAPLIEYLAAVDADIVCLQEVTRSPTGVVEWQTYRDGDHVLPQRSSLYDEISDALPAHEALFAAAACGTLFDAQDRPVASEWGLATFVRRTLTITAQRRDFIHGTFCTDGWGEHPRPRNALAVTLSDPAHGGMVGIVNLHGLRDPAGKGDTPARAAQSKRLMRLIGELDLGDDDGLIVCGDFNLLPDSATFRDLAKIGLTDLVVAGGHDDTRTSLYTKTPRFADYMLVNRHVAVERFEVVSTPEVSDHRPLLLTVG